jgi:hypothetical protein
MKKYIILIITITFLFSCNKSDDNKLVNRGIIGTWKLTQVLADPGNGSGTFNNVVSNKTLVFQSNGTVLSNGSICEMNIETNIGSSGTFNETTSTINSSSCPDYSINYELSNSTLIIDYFCIEPCRAKYNKVE